MYFVAGYLARCAYEMLIIGFGGFLLICTIALVAMIQVCKPRLFEHINFGKCLVKWLKTKCYVGSEP